MAMRWTLLLCCIVGAGPAWAVDTDILFHTQTRKAQAAPLCADLLARADSLPSEAAYQKAVCLLYGLQTPPNADAAIALLRDLALNGMTEAQLALADTLQQGDATQQKEALHWYGRASAAGDVRATLRHTRLSQRLQAAADAANAASTPDADDPYADPEANAARQPGYHCHFYGFGKKICHAGMD